MRETGIVINPMEWKLLLDSYIETKIAPLAAHQQFDGE